MIFKINLNIHKVRKLNFKNLLKLLECLRKKFLNISNSMTTHALGFSERGREAYKSMGDLWAPVGRTGRCMRVGMRGGMRGGIGAIGIGGRKGTGDRCIPFPIPIAPLILIPIPIPIPIPACGGGGNGWNEGGADSGCGGTTPPPSILLTSASMRSRLIFEIAFSLSIGGSPEVARSTFIRCHFPE